MRIMLIMPLSHPLLPASGHLCAGLHGGGGGERGRGAGGALAGGAESGHYGNRHERALLEVAYHFHGKGSVVMITIMMMMMRRRRRRWMLTARD
jgi:hypothetical protein